MLAARLPPGLSEVSAWFPRLHCPAPTAAAVAVALPCVRDGCPRSPRHRRGHQCRILGHVLPYGRPHSCHRGRRPGAQPLDTERPRPGQIGSSLCAPDGPQQTLRHLVGLTVIFADCPSDRATCRSLTPSALPPASSPSPPAANSASATGSSFPATAAGVAAAAATAAVSDSRLPDLPSRLQQR